MTKFFNPGDCLPRPLDASDDAEGEPAILLVDDHPFVLASEAQRLQSMGFSRVGTATGAESALALIRTDPHAVDVLISDLNMPGMDGMEFLRILSDEGFSGGVILLSGEGQRVLQAVQKLLERGPLRFLGALEKGKRREGLRAMIDTWKSTAPARPVAPERAPFTDADLWAAHGKGQWTLYYQPKVSLRDGSLAGFEALVRWAHPEQGLVMPNRFIDQAETSGLIDAMTDWILREALTQIARWRSTGLRTRVAANVSMTSLADPGFAGRVAGIVREMSMVPQDLVLEVTESRLIAPSAAPLENLVRLRFQRFGLSIDDFGTGHSSLAQLRDIPFTELKVDRGFVDGARFNPITRPLLEGSLEIAKGLGIQSVGEGVETEDDWRLLQELGCDLAQGYFIAQPMPPEAVGAWLETWAHRREALLPVADSDS